MSLQVKESRVELGDGQEKKIAKCFGGIEGGKKAAAELSNKESRATAKGQRGKGGKCAKGKTGVDAKRPPRRRGPRSDTQMLAAEGAGI